MLIRWWRHIDRNIGSEKILYICVIITLFIIVSFIFIFISWNWLMYDIITYPISVGIGEVDVFFQSLFLLFFISSLSKERISFEARDICDRYLFYLICMQLGRW